MSNHEMDRIEVAVETVVARYSLRNLRTLIIIAFLAGAWATTLQIQVARLLKKMDDVDLATAARVAEWTSWREQVDQFRRMGDRFTSFHWDVVATMVNRQRPSVTLPSYREVAREQERK